MKLIQLGGAFHQSLFIYELIRKNYFVACLDNVRQNPGHLYSSISFNISITKISEIKKILADEDYIISSYGSDIAELIRNILIGDYGNHMNLLKKFSARLFLKEVFSNENQPNIKLISLNENISNHKYLVKPNISSGSKGVSIINSKKEFEQAVKLARSISLDGLAVLEEYINNDGNKYYCEGLILRNDIFLVFGLSKSSKKNIIWDGSEQITEENISSFTELTYKYVENYLKEAVLKISRVISKKSFAFNIDFFINGNKIIIIEFSPRPGGNFLPVVLEHKFNIDHSLTYLSILTGENKIFYRKYPVFSKDSRKPLNISISNNKNKKDLLN